MWMWRGSLESPPLDHHDLRSLDLTPPGALVDLAVVGELAWLLVDGHRLLTYSIPPPKR